jgi:hypothetical protein
MAGQGLDSSRVSVETEQEGLEHFYNQRWTDGLPIVLPEPERVETMLKGTTLSPAESVGSISPGGGEATVEKIAINAVMAGCLPQYLPVVIAAVKATTQPQFNLHGVQTTTNPCGPMVQVNGQIRERLQINGGSNCFGPGWRANATIGRAVHLVLMNIGEATSDDVDKSTQGMPGKYSFCFAENEEESPWSPLHVERGFKPEDDVVTVTAPATTFNMAGGGDAEDLLLTIAHSLTAIGSNNFRQGGGEPMIAFCPQHANILADAGYSKDDVKRWLHKEARVPLEWLPAGVKAQRERLTGLEDPLPLAPSWEGFIIVVAGGPGGLHSTFLPTFGDTYAASELVAR